MVYFQTEKISYHSRSLITADILGIYHLEGNASEALTNFWTHFLSGDHIWTWHILETISYPIYTRSDLQNLLRLFLSRHRKLFSIHSDLYWLQCRGRALITADLWNQRPKYISRSTLDVFLLFKANLWGIFSQSETMWKAV